MRCFKPLGERVMSRAFDRQVDASVYGHPIAAHHEMELISRQSSSTCPLRLGVNDDLLGQPARNPCGFGARIVLIERPSK